MHQSGGKDSFYIKLEKVPEACSHKLIQYSISNEHMSNLNQYLEPVVLINWCFNRLLSNFFIYELYLIQQKTTKKIMLETVKIIVREIIVRIS